MLRNKIFTDWQFYCSLLNKIKSLIRYCLWILKAWKKACSKGAFYKERTLKIECLLVPPLSIALSIPNTSKHRLHVRMKPPCEPSPEYRELPCRLSRGGGCARPWWSGSARRRSRPRPSRWGWRGQAALSGLRWHAVVVVVVVVRGRICRTGASCCRSFGNWLTFAEKGMII